jgi:hypothetical protein
MTIEEANQMYSELSLDEAMRSHMAFGKYVGKELGKVSFSYLQWIAHNVQPMQNGADKVYRMIFAARRIVSMMHMPVTMPVKKQYSATPADIITFYEIANVMPYKVPPQKGEYIVVPSKYTQA